jgi:hypothetical protein
MSDSDDNEGLELFNEVGNKLEEANRESSPEPERAGGEHKRLKKHKKDKKKKKKRHLAFDDEDEEDDR